MIQTTTKPAPVNTTPAAEQDARVRLYAWRARYEADRGAPGALDRYLAAYDAWRAIVRAGIDVAPGVEGGEDTTDYGQPDLPDAIAQAYEFGWELGQAMTPALAPRGYSEPERRAWRDGYAAGTEMAEDEARAEVEWLCEAFSVPAEYAPAEFGGWGGHGLD